MRRGLYCSSWKPSSLRARATRSPACVAALQHLRRAGCVYSVFERRVSVSLALLSNAQLHSALCTARMARRGRERDLLQCYSTSPFRETSTSSALRVCVWDFSLPYFYSEQERERTTSPRGCFMTVFRCCCLTLSPRPCGRTICSERCIACAPLSPRAQPLFADFHWFFISETSFSSFQQCTARFVLG